MPFIEFSTAFSFDFGRRRKTQLPDGLTLEEVLSAVDLEDDDEPEKPGPKLGFQANPPREE